MPEASLVNVCYGLCMWSWCVTACVTICFGYRCVSDAHIAMGVVGNAYVGSLQSVSVASVDWNGCSMCVVGKGVEGRVSASRRLLELFCHNRSHF